MRSTNLWERCQECTMEKTIIFSINSVGKTAYSNAKEWNWTLLLQHPQKSTINGYKNWNYNVYKENGGGGYSLALVLAIYISSKSQATKEKISKWGYIKLKIFCTARNVQQYEKATYGMGEYIYKHLSDEG